MMGGSSTQDIANYFANYAKVNHGLMPKNLSETILRTVKAKGFKSKDNYVTSGKS